ncbi:uncharacterized protein EV420DRAFT_1765009 [Desarmillaria tabescens]|uniref:DUF6534 domain-containing protein n=1 Tax=Armillaria tabescens TaxID=1929756 RepID=A0AA39K9X1_ARMTA|nr:uncharacterized protein EV420DRAFT_1765009 [Desarmillaria tabescens]KAK0457267.1 hypothetical protein EV420DRAFT_1765009 [Desarmillaria tabescens]
MTLGAIYIGATIGAVFYGITILQTAIYYKQYPDDSPLFRCAVGFLWILDTLHVAISTHALYHYLVESFGNIPALSKIIWSFRLQLLINMLIVVCVQVLYAVRIWKFGRNFHAVLPWFIFLFITASLAVGIYVTYDMYTVSSILDLPTLSISIYAAFSTAAGADFAIAAAMCYYLHQGRLMAPSFSITMKIIVGLMRLVVLSGLATSACSILTLITYIVWPHSLIFVAISLILPKLYINSLLMMLNARKEQMRKDINECSANDKVIVFAHTSSSGASGLAETSIDTTLSVMERGHQTNGGTE